MTPLEESFAQLGCSMCTSVLKFEAVGVVPIASGAATCATLAAREDRPPSYDTNALSLMRRRAPSLSRSIQYTVGFGLRSRWCCANVAN